MSDQLLANQATIGAIATGAPLVPTGQNPVANVNNVAGAALIVSSLNLIPAYLQVVGMRVVVLGNPDKIYRLLSIGPAVWEKVGDAVEVNGIGSLDATAYDQRFALDTSATPRLLYFASGGTWHLVSGGGGGGATPGDTVLPLAAGADGGISPLVSRIDHQHPARVKYDTWVDMLGGGEPNADIAKADLGGLFFHGDMGEGAFSWNKDSTDPTVFGLRCRPTGVATGAWERDKAYSGKVMDTWSGALGDNTAHPISSYIGNGLPFPTLQDAQAAFPKMKSTNENMDSLAAESAKEWIKESPNYPITRGGKIYFPKTKASNGKGGLRVWNKLLDCDRTFGITLEGPSNGVGDGIKLGGGACVTYTEPSRYQNESNTAPVVSHKSSQYFTAKSFNVLTTHPDYWGHVFDGAHAGGNTIPRQLGVPVLHFHPDGRITRSGGPVGQDFLWDGWQADDQLFVRLSVSNNTFAQVLSVTADTIQTDRAWVDEIVSTAWLYSQTSDSAFPTFVNVGISSSANIPTGSGAKACISLSTCIFGLVSGCKFGVAERGVLISDNSAGFVYANQITIKDSLFQYVKYGVSTGRQALHLSGNAVEGLGGTCEAYYIDEHQRTTAQLDRTFHFDSVTKTITASSGDFRTGGGDKFQVGDKPFFSKRDGTLGAPALGTITNLTATVMTVDGTVPDIAAIDSYGIEIWDDATVDDRFPSSLAIQGNTLTVVQGVGGTIDRSDVGIGGSFLKDGYFIGEEVHGPGGGVMGIVTAVAAGRLTFDDLTAPAGAHDSDNYYIWNGAGASPLVIDGATWLGDQYRLDSWVKLLGSNGLVILGAFINGNARAFENMDMVVTGLIAGNNVSLTRPRSCFFFGGLEGAYGLKFDANSGATVCHKTFFPPVNLVMDAGRPLVDGETHDHQDTAFRTWVLRLMQGGTVTSNLSDTQAIPKPPPGTLLAFKGGDLRMLQSADGLILVDRDTDTAYRLKIASGVLGIEVVP